MDYGLRISGMFGRASHTIAFRLFFILFIFFICPSATAQKKKDNYPWISIGEIKACKSDTFRIQAKVIDRYHCPPCPKGVICKPCIGDHVTVVDTEGTLKQQEYVFTTDPEKFAENAVYVFTLTLQNKAHPEFGTDLVAFETLKK